MIDVLFRPPTLYDTQSYIRDQAPVVDAILEASHQNNTYTEEELALALVTGKVGLQGAFLRVA